MENLTTEPIKIRIPGSAREGTKESTEEYTLREKDHGDLVVYDIYHQDHYLLTLAADGSILFMNFDADEKDKQVFKLSHLNVFIEKIKAHV